MKVLLDECILRKLKDGLPGHDCRTVPEAGLAGKKNGELLRLEEKLGFPVFLTIDRGVQYQQNLRPRTLAILLIRTKSSRLADLVPHVPEILKSPVSIQPGQLLKIGEFS
jgi:hypothetical protein